MNKPRLKWAAIMMAALVSFNACKKDDDNGDDADDAVEEPTAHTTEENKDRVEAAGVSFVKNMEVMEDVVAIGVANSFSAHLGDSEKFGSSDEPVDSSAMKKIRNFEVIKTMKMLSQIHTGQYNSLDLMQSMKTSIEDTTAEEGKTIDELYAELQGTFSWTPDSTDFVFTEGTSGIIFEFPSTETGTSNNASLTITYSSQDVALPFGLEEEYSDLLPTSFTATLAADGVEQLKHELDITWLGVGLPGTIVNTLTMSPFVMSVSVNYDQATAGISYSFKNGTTNLLSYGASVAGDLSVNTIQAEIDAAEADTVGAYDMSDAIVTSASTWIQIMNIKVNGTIAPVEMINAIEDIDNNETLTDQQSTDAGVDAINEHIGISIIHMDNNETIATLEAFGEESIDEWEEWNESTQQYETVTDTDYDVNFRMVYPDGSGIDMEAYFETGFDDVVDELNLFFIEMNTDYDAGFDPIEYNVQ